jgi:hypothetical protein
MMFKKDKRSIVILIAILSVLTMAAPAWSATIEVRVSDGNDDAEETVSDGGMYTDSSDLELIYDGHNQLVGIRFQNVNIPAGSTITSAYIEFEVDEVSTGACSLTIQGQDAGDPGNFSSSDDDISDRTTTTASVAWSPADWNAISEKKQTPDIGSIVQEIVARGDWAGGNAMVFIITGSGRRTAEACEGESSNAPLLHVEYTIGNYPIIAVDPANLGAFSYEGGNAPPSSFTLSNNGSDDLYFSLSDDAAWFSCSPLTGALAPGADQMITVTYDNSAMATGTHEGHITITDTDDDSDGVAVNSPFELDVSLTIAQIPAGSGCGDVPIYAENLVDPAILILLDVSSSMTAQMPVGDPAGNPQTPDLSSIVQEIVDRGDWNSGEPMAFIFSGSGHRTAESYQGSSSAAPLLHIEYNSGGVFETRVSQDSDDAEERVSNGSMYLNSSDLELIYDGHDQLVGIRFQNVTIPNGATIDNAYIEFVIDESNDDVTNLVIHGEDNDNALTFTSAASDISNRTKTTTSVDWTGVPEWGGSTTQRRIDIGKDVISDLVQDRDISWGYGTWCYNGTGFGGTTADGDTYSGTSYTGPGHSPPYSGSPTDLWTKIHVGCAFHDDAHQTALQYAVTSTDSHSGTPFGPSLLAAREYFLGNKDDEFYETGFNDPHCQPKFLIDVTDGLGYPSHTTVALVEEYANALADAGISVVAVGFGIDNATQIQKLAEVSNARGHLNDPDNADDTLYALHDEVATVGQPFIAQSRQALKDALEGITTDIKAKVFHGSSPAPTTSVDQGSFVVSAQFNADGWVGDLIAKPYDPNTGAFIECHDSNGDPTCDPAEIVDDCICWTASEVMPATINAYTVAGPLTTPSGDATGSAIAYTDATLPKDNFLCKDLGDIIHSTPIIVGPPPFFYSFSDYRTFKDDYGSRASRVYVGSNDGAMHAFDLETGVEQWRFYPESSHAFLNSADDDASADMCDADNYCHHYTVDSSPVASDIYSSAGWKTILVTGLREGGESYFALDITSGNSFAYLWQFTDSDGELGQSWAEPTIDRVHGPAWAVFFSSGYSSDRQPTKEAYLFGVKAYSMDPLWQDASANSINRIKMNPYVTLSYDTQTAEFSVGETITGTTSTATAKIISVTDAGATGELELEGLTGLFADGELLSGNSGGAANVDGALGNAEYLNDALSSAMVADIAGDYLGKYIYTGNLYGNMYRVEDIGNEETPAVSTLFSFDAATPDHDTPIRAKADYAYGAASDEVWIYFGTGRYESTADKVNAEQQYFFGLKDSVALAAAHNPTYTLSSSPTPLVSLAVQQITMDADSDGEDEAYKIITGTNAGNDSWSLSLVTGGIASERVISQPLVVAGVVFFTTFTPDNNVCAGNGDAWLYALDYDSGLPPNYAVFDTNNDGVYNEDDMYDPDGEGGADPVPIAGIPIGRGLPSRPILEDDVLFVNTTADGTTPIKVNLPDLKAKLKSWRDMGL